MLHGEHRKSEDERRREKMIDFKSYSFSNGKGQVTTTCREISNNLSYKLIFNASLTV